MMADIEIDKETMRKFRKVIEGFVDNTSKTAEDAIAIIAYSSGRRLVNTVHPFGLKKGNQQIGNIGRQIEQTFYFVNAGVLPKSSLDAAHNRERRRGKVRLKRQKGTNRYQEIISIGEMNAFKRKQQAKAGRAKAAWVSAVEKIGTQKMSGIPAYIRRHVPSRFGTCQKTGKGMQHRIELANWTPYLDTHLQNGKDMLLAAEEGLRNGLNRIKKIWDKEVEKANSALQ